MNKIELAVMPLKQKAIDRAEKQAKETIERVKKGLAECGWDRQKYAPYPTAWNMSKSQYMLELSNYKLVCSLVNCVTHTRINRDDPVIVKMSSNKIKKFIDGAKDDAAIQYDNFVYKLVNKIGETVDATLDGDHVWGYSVLHVSKADGTTEKWKTHMIVNVSKLGKLFNQWPTRKIK